MIGDTIVWDQRDNRIDPTGGYYLQLDESFAGVGGTVDYRQVASPRPGWYYCRFAPKWVLAATTAYGDVHGVGQPVGIQDRFFIGGDDLRGFANGGIGPRDETTRDSLGGNQYYTASFTLAVPLGTPEELGLGGRIFTDMGTLYDINQTPVPGSIISDSHSLRLSSGVGISWKSPLGPDPDRYGRPHSSKPFRRA